MDTQIISFATKQSSLRTSPFRNATVVIKKSVKYIEIIKTQYCWNVSIQVYDCGESPYLCYLKEKKHLCTQNQQVCQWFEQQATAVLLIREKTEIRGQMFNFIQSQHSPQTVSHGSYEQNDKVEGKLNHSPLRNRLQSKPSAREAKVLIDHLVQMMEN